MLNKAPIFINGFARGGTNIITNLMASHPRVCMVAGETEEVFHGSNRRPATQLLRRSFYLPIWLLSRQHIFKMGWLGDRGRVPSYVKRYIDFLFYWSRLTVQENQYKAEGVRYTRSEIMSSHMLSKNVNGTVLATDLLDEMYPDATFIALVRNGLALCNGYLRRGFSAEYCGKLYNRVCQKMIYDSQHKPNYHIVRFEDMVADPPAAIQQIYEYAGLDDSVPPKFRFDARISMDNKGSRNLTLGEQERKVYWVELDDLKNYLRTDIDENQIKQISAEDRQTFLEQAESSMKYFGYPT